MLSAELRARGWRTEQTADWLACGGDPGCVLANYKGCLWFDMHAMNMGLLRVCACVYMHESERAIQSGVYFCAHFSSRLCYVVVCVCVRTVCGFVWLFFYVCTCLRTIFLMCACYLCVCVCMCICVCICMFFPLLSMLCYVFISPHVCDRAMCASAWVCLHVCVCLCACASMCVYEVAHHSAGCVMPTVCGRRQADVWSPATAHDRGGQKKKSIKKEKRSLFNRAIF